MNASRRKLAVTTLAVFCTSVVAADAAPVKIYSSLPLQGVSKVEVDSIVKGIKLAAKETNNVAGTTQFQYVSLDDSTAKVGGWDPRRTQANARQAAQDTQAIAYIGDFNSGASSVALPVLNQAGLLQISPSNTYDGLTASGPGADRGAPGLYYPTGKRNYVRLMPRDQVQAPALVTLAKQDGCKNLAIANDGEVYGAGLAANTSGAARRQSLKVVSRRSLNPSARSFKTYAKALKSKGTRCFLFSGVTDNGAADVYNAVHAALPKARLYGPDGVCEHALAKPGKTRVITRATAKRMSCTVSTIPTNAQPGGREFTAKWQAEYGGTPDPYALYGYESMRLIIDNLAAGADTREKLIQAVRATKNWPSYLGTYSFDANGDISTRTYAIYRFDSKGYPKFARTITAK